MLTCKEATRLLSQAQDGELPLAQRARLRFHLLLCRGCSNFKRQVEFLRRACRSLSEGNSPDEKD